MFSESENRRHAMAHIRREIDRAGGVKDVKKDKLVDLAAKLGVTVTSADGKKEPTKEEYLRALGF